MGHQPLLYIGSRRCPPTQNEKENVCTTETKPVDPEVEDITQQLLGEKNGGIADEDEEVEITCRISQEEKVLY